MNHSRLWHVVVGDADSGIEFTVEAPGVDLAVVRTDIEASGAGQVLCAIPLETDS
ncbi:hypothetical protein [Nevskia ramosa]|uniref:hypothetical protein n=1 Tax=Nevskia ramosa TaxID=64002 RepID=UPI0023531098|nr:hypothetical protein [Nevskia ramosa]